MPELPEVEVTRRRLEPKLRGKRFTHVTLRVAKLRLPVSPELAVILPGLTVMGINRRGKYLLFDCGRGWLLVHLGMSGFLQLLNGMSPPGKHDHLDFYFDDGMLLRFHDPRKFGTVVWFTGDPAQQPLLAGIGPEPLTGLFSGAYLFAVTRKRHCAIKLLIMNSAVVAGVGNIYANEALFRASIRPDRSAATLSAEECAVLAGTIREVLEYSISEGNNYPVTDAAVTYYPQAFKVYGRGNKPCTVCGASLSESRLGNRSTVYCPGCQK